MQLTKELIEYLDSYIFSGGYEIAGAILEFYKIENPSYWELADAWELAEQYIQMDDDYIEDEDAYLENVWDSENIDDIINGYLYN